MADASMERADMGSRVVVRIRAARVRGGVGRARRRRARLRLRLRHGRRAPHVRGAWLRVLETKGIARFLNLLPLVDVV